MKEITLANSDRVTLVDDEDFEMLSKYKWYLIRTNQVGCSGLIMARLLMKPGPDQDVDHINGNRLDNRRKNLRVCSHQENCFNHRGRKRGGSGFIGVYFHNKNRKWIADISIDYKTKYIGSFKSAEEAALARDAVAKELHGEFAVLNFPDIQAA